MSESSQQKTKRKYADLLINNVWSHQYSIFYDNHVESGQLLQDIKPFKQKLRRMLPEHPILTRVMLLNRDGKLQAYLTMHTTTDALDDITALALATFSSDVNVVGRQTSRERLEQSAKAILKQKPHNLHRFFTVTKINRYAVLNQHALISRKES